MEIAVLFRNDDADHAVYRKSWLCSRCDSGEDFLTIKKTIEVGDIQSFIQYVRSFTQPIQQIAQVANMLQMTAAASERVFEFLEEEEEEKQMPLQKMRKRKKMMHLSQSTRFIHYGQSIQTTVLMKNIKNFTVMYSTIIKSLYSGFI